MRIPPPFVFVLAFLAGVGLQRAVGLTVPLPPLARGIGIGLAVGGALLALGSVGIFLVARTTVVPFAEAARLITWGPYRFSRNPMYVSLIIAYVGLAIGSTQLLALVFLPAAVLFLRTIVIPFEEKRMRTAFGAAYEQYCSRVGRWL